MISAEKVSASYAGTAVFKEISFSLDDRSRLLISGPNGSGKTTLCKIIAGIRAADSGRVSVSGKISLTSPSLRAYSEFSAEQLILFTGLTPPHRKSCYHILNTLEGPPLNQELSRLSSGNRQKVMVSLALAADATTVILDEPFTHLDDNSASLLMDMLNCEERTIILTSHGDVTGFYHTHRINLYDL